MIGTPLLGIRKLGLGFLNERADVCMYVWMEKLGIESVQGESLEIVRHR